MTTNKPGAGDVPALRTTDLLVLIVLAEGAQHGYALSQELERRTRSRVVIRPGDLYRVLYRMTQDRLIEPVPDAARPGGDERRAYYRITPFGRRVVREQAAMLAELCAPLLARQPKREALS